TQHSYRNDSTRFRKACIFTTLCSVKTHALSLLGTTRLLSRSDSGFRGFSVRSKEKVAGEFSMICAAHNFKKIAKAIITGLIRPAFGNFTTNPAI
ncbi:MAG: hypothetical protein LUQ26_00235, partial [Methylococcaceae bacterium]|nr:hypothetical protein [Methylococcaceae bacterium]